MSTTDPTPDPWTELQKLPRNDLEAALAWRDRWWGEMGDDPGLGDALVRLFDDRVAFLRAAASRPAPSSR